MIFTERKRRLDLHEGIYFLQNVHPSVQGGRYLRLLYSPLVTVKMYLYLKRLHFLNVFGGQLSYFGVTGTPAFDFMTCLLGLRATVGCPFYIEELNLKFCEGQNEGQ